MPSLDKFYANLGKLEQKVNKSSNIKKGLATEKARRATLSQDFLKAHPAPVGNVKSPIKMNLPEPLHEKNLRTKPLGRGDALLGGMMTGVTLGAGQKALRQSMPEHSGTFGAINVGNLIGSALPWMTAYKAVKPIANKLPTLTNPILNKGAHIAATGALAGAPVGVAESLAQGERDPVEIAKRAAIYMGVGASGDLAIEGVVAPALKAGINYMRTMNEMTAVKGLNLSAPFKYTGPAAPFRGTRSGMLIDPFTRNLSPQEIMHGLQRDIGLTPNTKIPDMPNLSSTTKGKEYLFQDAKPPQMRETKPRSGMMEVSPLINDQLSNMLKPVVPKYIPMPGQGVKTMAESIQQPSKVQTMAESIELPPKEYSLDIPLSEIKMNIPKDLPDTLNHVSTKTKNSNVSLGDKVTKVYSKMFDTMHRIRQMDNEIYRKAQNNRGGADMVAHTIMTERMVNPKGEVIGGSLSDLLKPIGAKQEKQFADYMINRHAPSWLREGRKVFQDTKGITPDEYGARISEAKAAQYEAQFPHFKQVAEQWDNWWKDFGQAWLVDSGLMSQKQWEIWRNKYPHYVKFQRKMADVEKSRWSLGKRPTGSERPIISPVESAIEDIDHIVKRAKENEVRQLIAEKMMKNPDEMSWWGEVVKTEKELSPEEIAKADDITKVIDNGEEYKIDPKHGNIITAKIKGKPVQFKVHDKMLLDSLQNLNFKGQNFVVDTVGTVTRHMKNLTTGINPIFALGSNIFRDIPTAYILSKSTNNPFVFAKDLVSAFVDVAKNREAYKEFKGMGGGHSSSISADRNLLEQSKAKVLPGYYTNSKNPLTLGKRIGSKGVSLLENLNNAVESAPRLAEYKRFSKEGTYESRQRGLYEANDITVNFKRYGRAGKDIDAFVPYFNAAMQGMDKVTRSFVRDKGYRKQTVLKSILAITVPTVVLYSINKDNPAYKKLSDYVKDSNFIFPRDDGTFIKIPKPRELGVVFGSAVERSLRLLQQKDPESFTRFMTTIADNFAPPVRTIASPLNDVRANKDFANRPIIPGYMVGLSPENQHNEKTSSIAKSVGGFTGTSPMMIDYLGKSYGGVISQLGIPAASEGNSIENTLSRKFVADPTYSNDVLGEFYDTKTKLDTAQKDFKVTSKKGKNYNDELRLYYNRASNDISELNKKIRIIESNKSLSPKAKETQIKRLKLQILDISQKANNKAKESLLP